MKLSDKIEIELTEDDMLYIQNNVREDICRYLSSLRDRSFKIGDVLVKKIKKSRITKDCSHIDYWEHVMVPYRKVPAKYVVVHVDDNGIPTVKRLSVKGYFTGNIQSLADVDFRNEIFEEDPDMLEALLLNEDEFDPIRRERNRKRKSKLV